MMLSGASGAMAPRPGSPMIPQSKEWCFSTGALASQLRGSGTQSRPEAHGACCTKIHRKSALSTGFTDQLCQDTHVFEGQHDGSDNPSHHHHYSQDTEEACARGKVHLPGREREARVRRATASSPASQALPPPGGSMLPAGALRTDHGILRTDTGSRVVDVDVKGRGFGSLRETPI